MRKRFLCPLFLLAALFLTVSASAAGETPPGRIEIANRAYSDASFSCDVKLSGTTMQGKLFAVVCAESERVKSVSDYPAAETVKVTLQNVADTDSIRMLWVDAKHMPLASPAVLRMRGNGSAAYAKFAQGLAELAASAPSGGEGASADAASVSADPYILARLLVSCNDPSVLNPYKNKAKIVAGLDNFYVLQFRDPAEAKKCEQELQSRPSVRYVEPDVVLKVDINAQADETARLQAGSLSWGVEKTGIGEYAENLRKRGFNSPIVVAVVDSGVDANHPFLQGRLIDGYDCVEGDDTPQDEHGHGTHVAGTIVDCTPDMNVKIMTVRVLNAFAGGSHLSIINGIDYAANHGAHVINLSLSVNWKFHQAIEDAINRALSKNITVVVAAGNEKGNAKYCSPANMEECITVAAVNSDLKRFDLSNYGDAVDIAAPGEKVTSCLPGGITGEMDGTSMATPHVSAAVALLMCERGTGQTPFQISNLIRNAATEIPVDIDDGEWKYWKNFGETRFLGAGFLNMYPFFMHTVTLIGAGTIEPFNVSHGDTVTLPRVETKSGYNFYGWNTKADGSGTSYADGASLTVIEDTTLYAQWKPIEWTVTLDANDGSARRHTVTVSVDNPFAWPDNPFSRTGYTLDGWNTKPNGSGTSYADKASLTVTADMTLYAQWKQIILDPIPVKPISWGTTATHMDEYASLLQKRGLSSEVIVAEIGSGVDANHPFLQGRLVAGYDFVEHDDTPQDEHGHSTHLAGIIADCTPNNVKIMPVRVLNAHASGTLLDIINGIRYAVDHNANVICLALSIRSNTEMLEDTIQYAIGKGVTVVVAAGNYNGDAKNYCPANIEDCITVAAVDKDLKRHGVSNYGEAVDIAAPGVDINSCIPDGKYGEKTGTSMCTAYVVGAAAMLMCEYGTDRTPTQIADLLKSAAKLIPYDKDDLEWTMYRKSNPSGTFLGAGFLDMSPFISHTVTFDANGGTGSMKPLSAVHGKSVTLTVNELSRTGYEFDHWNTKADDSGTSYADGASLTVIEDTTLYAQWKPIEWTVTFDANDASGRTRTIAVSVEKPLTRPENPFDRTGYEFTDWYSDKEVATPFDFSKPVNANTTIYAGWSEGPVNGGLIINGATAQQGETDAVIPVTIAKTGNVGLTVLQFDVTFPDELILAEKPIVGTLFADKGLHSDRLASPYIVSLGDDVSMTNVTEEGVLITLNFKVKADAAPGDYEISIANQDNYNADIEPVALDVTPGKISVVAQSPYALLYEDGEMVFQNGTASNSNKNLLQSYPVPTEDGSAQYAAWYPQRNRIRTVTFADAIQPALTALWFYGCENLTEIRGLENLDASQVTDMSQMFARCTSLTELDLSAWDTKSVTNMRQMFFQCASLTAIYASDAFNVANVTESSDMFTGCASLVSGAGTQYDSAHTDKEYARIDGETSAPGYFTHKNASSNDLPILRDS